MRAFVAVVPPAEVLAPLVPLLPSLRERWPGVGWIPPERWHFTVCFLGDLGQETIERVASGIAPVAAATPAIPARVGPGGTFPGGKRPRVVWVGIAAPAALGELAARVADVARGAGVVAEDRPYRAHITLGRVRRESPSDAEAMRRALDVASDREFVVDALVLFRSHLGPSPRYEELARWPLTGPAPA